MPTLSNCFLLHGVVQLQVYLLTFTAQYCYHYALAKNKLAHQNFKRQVSGLNNTGKVQYNIALRHPLCSCTPWFFLLGIINYSW